MCSGAVRRAHTIQKEGGLRAIAESGHVVSVKKAALDLARNQGRIVPAPDGIGNASTFPGFCNAHDAIFAPAERATVILGKEAAFLLSYRAAVYEKFNKEAALRFNMAMREESDKGRPFDEQAAIQSTLYLQKVGLELGLKDAIQFKAAFDEAFLAAYTGFDFVGIEFDSVLPLVSCGAFFPEFDLFGKRVGSLGAPVPLDPLVLNLTVLNARSVLFLGWIGDGGPPEKFAESFARIPDVEKANAAVRLAIEHVENTYCRPSWWNSLSESHRRDVIANAWTMEQPPVSRRRADGSCIDGKILATGTVRAQVGKILSP
jgi:hypothetical protein